MSWSKFCYWTLTKVLGWTADDTGVTEEKCVILGVPHTSIADFFISYLFYTGVGRCARIMIKKEFFFWPVGPLLKKVGCIPVDRSNGATVIRSVITAMENAEGDFHLCLSPEGTRKAVKRWKHGYHKIASEMNCPVYCGYFDWKTKHVGSGQRFELTDDVNADTARLQEFYASLNLTGRHPEKYITK